MMVLKAACGLLVAWLVAMPAVAGPQRVRLKAGESHDGVNRHAPVALLAEKHTASPDVAVASDGSVWVAFVVLEDGRERIWVRRAGTPGAPFGPARPVSPKGRPGARAWHPRLAAAPDGGVWLAWCGLGRAPKRGRHDRHVFVRRMASDSLGRVVRVSTGGGRAADPALAVAEDGAVHLVWEQARPDEPAGSRVVYRMLSPRGSPQGEPVVLAAGPFARRPAVCTGQGRVHVAWDALVTTYPTGSLDPDYDVFMRTRGTPAAPDTPGSAWGPVVTVDRRDGIQAAPSVVPAPGGGVLVAYHSSHRHGLVKQWVLRRVRSGKIEQLAVRDRAGEMEPRGEVQGSEFPCLVLSAGRVLITTRPSQSVWLERLDENGVSPVFDLTRGDWGARGMRCGAAASANQVLVARRTRRQVVLERFSLAPGGGSPPFEPANDAPKTPRKRLEITARRPAGAPADLSMFFGDIHMHSAMTDGTGPPDEILARAWDRGQHFAALTDHDAIVGSLLFPSAYDEIAWVSDAFDAREGFCTLHAYEWTSPPVPRGAGHRNVYFRGQAPVHICGYRDDCPDTASLMRAVRRWGAIAVPHHTSWTGTDWDAADPRLQPLFEIVSTHGASEMPQEQPIASRGSMRGMFAVDGLRRGLRFGFVGGSDGHGLLWHHGIGRRRDPWRTGLTGVLATTNRRAAVFDALAARRTVATSGVRMHAYLTAGGKALGAAGTAARPIEVQLQVAGTRPLVDVAVLRDGQVVHRVEPTGDTVTTTWRDRDVTPGLHAYYLRAVEGAGKDRDVVWTSPVFIEVKPTGIRGE